MIHIWNSCFENICSSIKRFYICTEVPVEFQKFTGRIYRISDFLAESLRANKNYLKRSHIIQYSFAQKTSLILRTSIHLTSKILCSRNTAKNLSAFTNFPANMFLFGARKNISLNIKQYDKKTNKQANKKQVKHGAIKKVCHLHNIIFHFI